APDSIFETAKKLNLTRHQVVTMASIEQWEVLQRDEWGIVSSVYHNRLRRRMLLQADPTVNYALGRGPSRLTYRELKIDSPYNTYIYKGLPPGPINNPGLRAIQAVLQPEKTDYLFFVARGDGSHIFSKTAEEHNRAKAEAKATRERAREDTTRTG
ncbi:endolytic transglycosylase MltG, partial [bacterium]|nr:endolytic transglycosylase MltG [bacterium]